MFEVIALLAKRPDLTREQFISHYETRHALLIQEKFPWIAKYHRNYIDLSGAILAPTAGAPDFDVVTEIWFKDRADYERMLAAHALPTVGPVIAEDEGRFLDRTKTRFFVVDEHASASA